MALQRCSAIAGSHVFQHHAVQESVAMGESLINHIKTGENLSDLMTMVVNTVDLLQTSYIASTMTMLHSEARPAN
jgi:hypothetical protein